MKDDFFTVSGTTAHIFPGSEILACAFRTGTPSTARPRAMTCGTTAVVFIRTPGPGQYFINGLPVQAGQIEEGLFVLKASL